MINRVKKLQQQVNIEPLVWNPKKGEVLIGNYDGYDYQQKGLSLLLLRDRHGVIHRVSLNKELTEQIFAWGAKIIPHDDLISIQFLGVERDEYGKKNPVYNFVIDRALDAGKESNAITISTLDA